MLVAQLGPGGVPINQEGAETVYGETASLYPRTNGGTPYNSGNWNSASYSDLQNARTAIADIRERNKITNMMDGSFSTNPIEQRAWSDSVSAANRALNFNLGNDVNHFFIRQDGVGMQVPWWATGVTPYQTFGPFINVGSGDVPAGNNTYIDVYKGIP